MVIFPNAKINIGLNITKKRLDGFHDLETIFFPIHLKDCLEIIVGPNNQKDPVSSTISGIRIDGNPENNLCIKAYHLLKNDFPQIPPIQLYLHKTIPIGAGLGGGSSDGAHMLLLMNQVFSLNLNQNQLVNYALQLGSDCPFFIYNQASFATGRGEKITPIELTLSSFKILIVNPGIHIHTGWAFNQISEYKCQKLSEFIQQPISKWKDHITNDFENPVFEEYPEIKKIKDDLYQHGAVYASMSGTGSTIFGIFEKEIELNQLFPATYFTKWV